MRIIDGRIMRHGVISSRQSNRRFRYLFGASLKNMAPEKRCKLGLLCRLRHSVVLQNTGRSFVISRLSLPVLGLRLHLSLTSDLWLQRTLQEWTATKWLEIDWQFANKNCYTLSRVSWALI